MDIKGLIEKYKIDIEKLKKEQEKLSKQIEIKDSEFPFDKFCAIDNSFIKNKMISAIIVCDKDFEILDKSYSFSKLNFPYIPGFRAYRELPGMLEAFNKLREKPDVVFIFGQGITHPRLGIASHFSISTGLPTIGIANNIKDCEIKKEDILKNNKKVGKVLIGKPGSRPLYISPGNLISIKKSYELCKNFIKKPHKLPEPLYLSGKYARKIKKELI